MQTFRRAYRNLNALWLFYLSFAPPLLLFLVSQWVPVYIERALLPSGVVFCIWLAENASPGDFVLSSELTGELAARAGLRVYLRHNMETLDYAQKTAWVEAFFRGQMTGAWLADTGCRWVIYGPYEQWPSQSSLEKQYNLEAVYSDSTVIVYEVSP